MNISQISMYLDYVLIFAAGVAVGAATVIFF